MREGRGWDWADAREPPRLRRWGGRRARVDGARLAGGAGRELSLQHGDELPGVRLRGVRAEQ